MEEVLESFDQTLTRIEVRREKELTEGQVMSMWEKNSVDEIACTDCDARTFFRSYGLEKALKLS